MRDYSAPNRHKYVRLPLTRICYSGTNGLLTGETEIFSDKRNLPYELSSVVMDWNKTDDGGVRAPSLIYLNNTLQDCTVTDVQVFLDNVIDSDALTLSRAHWNPRLSVRSL